MFLIPSAKLHSLQVFLGGEPGDSEAERVLLEFDIVGWVFGFAAHRGGCYGNLVPHRVGVIHLRSVCVRVCVCVCVMLTSFPGSTTQLFSHSAAVRENLVSGAWERGSAIQECVNIHTTNVCIKLKRHVSIKITP